MNDIKNIKNPDFLKKMTNNELETLASDIRKFIIESVSVTGGHLSSNLGIVDLTISIMKVFDYRKDIILFDVGHQAYTYKILTGRGSKFDTLRKTGGLSGFQSISESNFDHYEAGHSSTILSAGLGFAIARDLNKEKYNVITIIGDGSIGNGLSYEALNHIGDSKSKQIIILNDNEMSISKNVGAIHNFLDSIRANKTYNKAKKNTKSILRKIPLGKYLYRLIDQIKSNLKKIYLKKGSTFNELGIEYYGPINGHDYEEMEKYLNIAKNETRSVLLHVITQKGKGYKYAEEDSIGKYHGISPFDIETGEIKNPNNLPSYSEIISSYVYNFARKDKNIICITPGMAYGSRLEVISKKLPDQFIDVGIAEEHALVLANSLAICKRKPIVFIYSSFLQRGYDQLVHDIARMDSNVLLCIDRCGIIPGDGVSHQGLFDIPFMISIPNMIIACPKDAKEANDLIYTALNTNHPFALRYPKTNIKYDYGKAEKLNIGSWEEIKKGFNGTIISYGDFLNRSVDISNILEKDNISIGVINARFIKPIDKELLNILLGTNQNIYVYEESMKIGSLGSLICEYAKETDSKSKIYVYGIDDKFVATGSREELIKNEKLDDESISKNIKITLK